MNFLSLNVCGIRDANKRMSLMQWLGHRRLDIVCLQETHAVSASESAAWFSPYGFLTVLAVGSAQAGGLPILYRPRLILNRSWVELCGRFSMAEFMNGNFSFELYVSTLPIATQSVTPFCFPALILLIPLFLLFFAETSMPFGIAARTEGGRLMIPPITTARPLYITFSLKPPDTIAFSWTRHDGLLASRNGLFGYPLSRAHGVHACDFVPLPLLRSRCCCAWGFSPCSAFSGPWTLETQFVYFAGPGCFIPH